MKISKLTDKRYWMRYHYAKYFTSRPVDSNAILFESFHGKEISDTPLAMLRALLEMPEGSRRGLRLYFSTNDTERDEARVNALGLDVTLVHIHSDDYARLLATAGILINNSSFPSYYVRRDEQLYLQTWHGTPWKTLGKEMKGGIETMHNAQHNFLQASHLLFPNDFTREAIMRDYNLDHLFTGKVITHGYPRNSVFSDSARAAEIKKLCGDEGISTLAYMPTWRGADNKNIETDDYCREVKDQLRVIDEALSDDQKLYVNLHPIIQKGLDTDDLEHIFTFPAGIEKYDFINSMDALITDYSSIFFDYSITGKPIILYTYDYQNYVSERGMYFGIEELPFRRVDTLSELTEMLKTRSYEAIDYSGDETYRQRFTSYDTVTAADDLMRYMLAELGKTSSASAGASGIRVEDLACNRDKVWDLVDCPKLPTPYDVDVFSESIDPDKDLVIFHQKNIAERIGKRIKEEYQDAYEYIFTTESVPQTVMESLSRRRAVRKRVALRNRRRQTGGLTIGKVTKYRQLRVDVESFRTSGTHTYVRMSCPVRIGRIRDIVLRYRSNVEDITHSLKYEIRTEKDRYVIKADADLSVLRKGCVYWDLYVLTEREAREGLREEEYHAMLTKAQRMLLKGGYFQCDLGDYIAFPHISLFEALAFTNREKTPYDGLGTRLKELTSYTWYLLAGKGLRKKNIWLVFEKFCSAAQDNGYYFFKYCMDNLPEEEKRRIFFVIDKKSGDYANVAPYSNNVLEFMSWRHLLYSMAARVYVGSDSRKHLYIWRPKPNVISGRMRKKPIHFLQHGVTALKRVDGIFGASGSSPMTSITTTSRYEQEIMDEYFGYTPANAPVVGFTRWDVLEDKSTPDERIILVMPTWRAWLEEKTDEDFLASDYFRNYMTMLQDESLAECLRDNSVKLIFFIHPKFKDFLGKFSTESENIELVQFGSRPLNEIMMHCSMLITDYSSVCWDVYYMGKPVVFYQFDYDMYMDNHGSYLDMENELFGERYTELSDVIESIRRNIENGFTESEKAREMRSRYFEYIDNDNSKRTYEYLKKRYK